MQMESMQCQANHTLCVKHRQGKVTAFIVYVDDIVVIGDDYHEFKYLKFFLGKEFEMKDLGPFKYFLGIEVARSKDGLFLSQHKYVLDLFQDFGMLGCKLVTLPLSLIIVCMQIRVISIDIGHHQRLVGKLIYLTLSRPNTSYVAGVVSQFIHALTTRHIEAVTTLFAT